MFYVCPVVYASHESSDRLVIVCFAAQMQRLETPHGWVSMVGSEWIQVVRSIAMESCSLDAQ
jgi:hypothetical protein